MPEFDTEFCLSIDIDVQLLETTIAGGQEYGHYLDGDGYLTRVTIDNGKVVGIALEFQLLHRDGQLS